MYTGTAGEFEMLKINCERGGTGLELNKAYYIVSAVHLPNNENEKFRKP